MARECDVLGQLNSDTNAPVQVALKLWNNAKYEYNSKERVVEVTSGRVGIDVPEGYALLCQTEGALDGRTFVRRPPYDNGFNVWLGENSSFALVKLSELNIVCEE